MEHDLGSEFTSMKDRAVDQIIQDMGISSETNNNQIARAGLDSEDDEMLLKSDEGCLMMVQDPAIALLSPDSTIDGNQPH